MRYIFFFAIFFVAVAACRPSDKNATATDSPPADTADQATAKTESAVKKLYVHAAKGLVLRKSPSKDGEKITTLAHRSPAVKVLETALERWNSSSRPEAGSTRLYQARLLR